MKKYTLSVDFTFESGRFDKDWKVVDYFHKMINPVTHDFKVVDIKVTEVKGDE